ncbi:hypothetical protein D3C87_1919820 [compost metagenome]
MSTRPLSLPVGTAFPIPVIGTDLGADTAGAALVFFRMMILLSLIRYSRPVLLSNLSIAASTVIPLAFRLTL